MRPLWIGSINFGLINIPVNMYSGSNPRQGLELDMLHRADHAPIRYARICRKDGEEIAWADIVKGYEYRDGDYIVLTQKDLQNADAKKTKTIDIQLFTDESEIDIRYFEKPYYLEPIKGGEKAYSLLRDALAKSGKAAVVIYVFHEREHLGVIKPVGKALVLDQMRFPTDIRPGTGLDLPAESASNKELDMALQLIKQQTKHFIPEDFHDTYTEELEQLIKSKTKGKKSATKQPSPAKQTEAQDLMQALKASLNKK